MVERDAADRVPHGDLVVGGAHAVGEADGQLLLPGPQLGIVLLGMHALREKRLDDVHHHRRRRVHAGRGAVRAPVQGDVAVRLPPGEAELVLEGRLDGEALPARPGDHPPEEAPRAGLPGLAVGCLHVAEDAGALRRVRQHGEGVEVRDEPELTHRAEGAFGDELVQHGERLHGDRHADPRPEVGRQELEVAGLAPDHAVVAAVEEADQLGAGRPAPAEECVDLTLGHSLRGLLALRGRHGPSPSIHPATHPYQRWLGAGPSPTYAIFIRLR